ncbi:carbamoyltransferase C-terminal domain-containing protein [Lentzea sp. DG1S-22]|uniref:carbamoyltransferase family protein n=1 Tax=Lentzea sp. DG1S-22 TaxID=3108822 RepID=UPI002E7A8455|nr:carbamoyltransferase C-terminal domain-containing protein [Lentzea sp. DG1S-22]WVH81692.1 carbamoyltransferase C-terminal domain-containing protein [Lentzea sp. DG1S-22]
MRVLGINAVFHDPAAALVVDGEVVAAAEEERFSRRKHGKRPVPFSTWEQPELSARWCLEQAGLTAADLDAVAYSYDPALVDAEYAPWEELRTTYARKAPQFLATSLPGLDPDIVQFVPHHVAHAASTGLAAPFGGNCAVLVADGRGECGSHLAGRYVDQTLTTFASQRLPHSLGLMYEDLTEHLGFLRSSDEYKVMALASHAEPVHLDLMREHVVVRDGGFEIRPLDWSTLAKQRGKDEDLTREHAELAASVQVRLEEVLLELVRWLHERTGETRLTMAGGVALNCVANTRIFAEGPFDEVWVQPAAGDAGTALGAALHASADVVSPMPGADLGRGFTDDEIESALRVAAVPYKRSDDVALEVAEALAANKIVAWFQGRSEYGPRALGRRSLLANPCYAENLTRLNDVKGREQFRPVAPMVLASRAADVFTRGPIPSPYMLFVHDVRPEWTDRIPAVVHVDGTARAQTVDGDPLLERMLHEFEARSGVPVVVNTSLNTAGRPMVDSPRDALECFGSSPIDLLAIGPFVVRR